MQMNNTKISKKEIILGNWRSKIGYCFNYKDLEELEIIINYYEEVNKELHNKIDKAIEYIEETLDLKEEYTDEVECVVVDLFEILKGSGVNE